MVLNKNTKIFVIVVLVLLNLLIYVNSINNEFLWDDVIVQNNIKIRDTKYLKDLLLMEDSVPNVPGTGFFRPFVNITYLIDYQIHQGKPYGFRITNIMFHILCSVALFFLIMLIAKDKLLAFVAAAIFSVQAVHVEAVSLVVHRNNVICTLFIILSLYFYIKNKESAKVSHLIYSMICLFLGAASKEFAFVVPVIFILYDLSFDENFSLKKQAGKYIAAFSTIFIFLLYKSLALTQGSNISFGLPTLYKRVINTFSVMVEYIVSMIIPYNLTIHYDRPMKESFFDISILGSVLILLGLVFIVFKYRKREKVIFFSLFAHFILLVPVSNIIETKGAFMADRWLYPASAFFSLFLARIILLSFKKNKALVAVFTIVFTILLSFFAIQRNADCKNELTFFAQAVESNPKDALSRSNLAHAYQRRKRLQEAEGQYLLGLQYAPEHQNNYITYNNLGALYVLMKEPERAKKAYRESLSLNSNYAPAAHNFANLLKDYGDLEKSIKYYKIAISINPEYHSAYYNLGLVCIKLKRYDEAEKAMKKALTLSPGARQSKEIMQTLEGLKLFNR